ncbi:MAG TPA: HEAT repeat domain-containing protein [Verrucomicrobiae bacterium]|nr:HEAT repeat domain-containing protein [Verrucomicrobiae bacterium]
MRKNAIVLTVLAALAALAGALAWQQAQIRALQSELAVLKSQPVGVAADHNPRERTAEFLNPDQGTMPERLLAMEKQVQQLMLASESLMERGQLPLSPAKAIEVKNRFLDASLSSEERLRALRLLQKNHAIDDEVLSAGLAWIETLSDTRLMSDLLEQFVGLKSPALREKALQLVATHPEDQIRRRAVQILGASGDARVVESALWTLLASEQSRSVQYQLEEALREIPMDSTRQLSLEQRALNDQSPLRERLAAFRLLMAANVASAQTVKDFANTVLAQNNADQTAELFRMFDNTGNLAAAPALINGLQLDNPHLRALALDALSEMQSEPTVIKWLQHAAMNDTDERVRAEAVRVLGQAGNKPQ